MKFIAQPCFLILSLSLCPLITFGQGFSVESKARPSATTETFTSLERHFTIGLPAQVSSYSAGPLGTAEARTTSDTFTWATAQGLFMIICVDMPSTVKLTSSASLDLIRNSLLAKIGEKGRIASEVNITLQGNPGRELRIELPFGISVARIYVVGKRFYHVIASLSTARKALEPEAVKILDSFRFLTEAEVDAAQQQKLAEASPSPLPQQPVTSKPGSDAEDEGLKGKVNTVSADSEDLSGTWAVGRRKPSYIEYYNDKGNLTKRVSYDWKGNLFQITVYGYLDGARVSQDKTIRHEYDPPPMLIGTAPGEAKPKYDPRYHYKREYKYDDKKKLSEEILYSNDGKLWLRYVYKYTGKQKEEFVYSEDGRLNQHYLFTLDDNGNKIEQIDFDINSGSISEKDSYAYELDAKGNWTKRTTSKWVTKDGRSYYEPAAVYYRTITYY